MWISRTFRFSSFVESIRYIGGFGRMSWVNESDWKGAEADPLAPFAQGIIDHMNDDHADIMVLYCTEMSKASTQLRPQWSV